MTANNSKVNVLDLNYTDLNKWWENYKKDKLGWAYLEKPSPILLTNLYAEMVCDGSITANKEVTLACQRHLKDLKRQGTDEFPWIFDEKKAWRPIHFIEEKCIPSKGNYSRMVLQPWQHFVVGSLFGWVHRDTGYRRFREGLIFVGRKNGKTTLESGLADYMAGFDGERGANIYFLSNSQDQSHKLFDEAKAMIDVSPYLSQRFITGRSEIRFPKRKCSIVPMSADKNNKDGENLHFAVFDEIHEYHDYKLINVMKRSRGTREQPLIVYISTAGTVLDGPLMDFVDNGQDCLTNYDDHIDERTFYYLARLDNVQEMNDPNLWVKANPNICLMKTIDLITDFKKDRRNPSELADWITKQFNIFSETDELSFVSTETILKNNRTLEVKELLGRECVGGYDLSETEDFTAACLEFPLDDGSIFLLEKSWIPEARFKRDKNPDRIKEWEKAGEIEIVPGEYVNYEYVLDWFIENSKKYNISLIRYDRAKALQLNKELESYGFVTDKVIQGFTTLGGPMQNFKELLLDGKVIFNNSRLFRWYLNNVKLRKDRNDNWMPDKQSRSRKIDGFAAALNAHATVVDKLIDGSSGNVGFISLR